MQNEDGISVYLTEFSDVKLNNINHLKQSLVPSICHTSDDYCYSLTPFLSVLPAFIPSLHSHHYYLRSYPHALFLYIYIFLKIVLLFTYLPNGTHCEDTTRLISKRKLSFTGLALPKYSFFFPIAYQLNSKFLL